MNLKTIFLNYLAVNLAFEGIGECIELVVKEYKESLDFAKSSNRSVIGSLNNVILMLKSFLAMRGGFYAIDPLRVNRYLNRIPHVGRKFSDPLKAMHEKLGLVYKGIGFLGI